MTIENSSLQAAPVNVLLVEDNPGDALLIQTELAEEATPPFALKHATCLKDALDVIAHADVDVIILDLTLPDAAYLEGLERLRSEQNDLPIVVLTGLTDDRFALYALNMGADDYLVKGKNDRPFIVQSILHALVRRQRATREIKRVSTELCATRAQLVDAEKLTRVDPLTGLYNRRGLQQILSERLQQARRGGELLALLLDLDNFKHINDTLGHAAGDVVLQDISHKLISVLRATDSAGRIGGDEFLILLPDTRLGAGRVVAEKIRMAVSGTPLLSPIGISNVTGSVGLIRVPEHTVSIEELISEAHLALLKSKESGKNCVFVDTKGMGEESAANSGSSIYSSLSRTHMFNAVKQPILRLADEHVIGFEFFSRCSEEAIKMPADFFRLSGNADILAAVDRRCFKTCAAASAGLPAHLACHLNLFPTTLLSIPTAQLLKALPARPRETYCIEVSEQQIVGEPFHLVPPIEALKEAGLRIALDDVGYGRSSLESLIALEPHVIKIDPAFISGIAKEAARRRSLERLIKVATSLGAVALAEGIESRADLEALQSLGITLGQGRLWGEPA